MHRIDHNTKADDINGAGKDGFTEGSPGTIAATRLTDDWLNDIQEEICSAIESTDTLVKGDQDQLLTTLRKLFVDQAVTNWTPATPAASVNFGFATATDGTYFAVVEYGGQTIQYTTDGITWTSKTVGGALYGLAYGNGYWVAVGASGAVYYATSPGGTWTANPQSPSATINSVYYGNGYWVAAGVSGNIYYKATNPTGAWLSSTIGAANHNAVIYAAGYWVAVGSSGQLYYKATDPTGSWTSNTQGSADWVSIAYGVLADTGVGTWVIVSGTNAIRTATAVTGSWTSRASAWTAMTSGAGVAYGAGCFILVGQCGDHSPEIYNTQISFDGVTWTNKASGLNDVLRAVGYFNNCFITAGTSGVLRRTYKINRFMN